MGFQPGFCISFILYLCICLDESVLSPRTIHRRLQFEALTRKWLNVQGVNSITSQWKWKFKGSFLVHGPPWMFPNINCYNVHKGKNTVLHYIFSNITLYNYPHIAPKSIEANLYIWLARSVKKKCKCIPAGTLKVCIRLPGTQVISQRNLTQQNKLTVFL